MWAAQCARCRRFLFGPIGLSIRHWRLHYSARAASAASARTAAAAASSTAAASAAAALPRPPAGGAASASASGSGTVSTPAGCAALLPCRRPCFWGALSAAAAALSAASSAAISSSSIRCLQTGQGRRREADERLPGFGRRLRQQCPAQPAAKQAPLPSAPLAGRLTEA